MDEIAPMIVTVVLIVGIAWMVRIVGHNRRLDRLAKMHNDLQVRILDRLGSSQELLTYVNTEPGKRLLEAPVDQRDTLSQSSPYGKILFSAQAGIVLALGGGAFLLARGMVPDLDDTGFAFLGVLALALGIGFLASAAAAHLLSKSYGLFDGRRRDGEQS